MSTRAFIGIRWKDGTITSIYNHSDGYPSYLGRLLLEKYPSESDAKAIVSLGDLSILRERLEPKNGEKHSFENRSPRVTVAYHRDLGEPLYQLKSISTVEFVKTARDSCGRYAYLFDCGLQQWLYRNLYSTAAKHFVPLTLRNLQAE